MVGPIESVTIAVAALERSQRFFEEAFGLTQVSDGRASVGLLSAWRYPVHESVRLVELAYRGDQFGRVRLASYEDTSNGRVREGAADASGRALSGPCALDFRATGSEREPELLEAPDDAAVVLNEAKGAGGGALASAWILSAATDSARRFYTEALGYRVTAESEVTLGEKARAFEMVGIRRGARVCLTRLGCQAVPRGGVILVRLLDGDVTMRPPRLGRLGINLLTCRCEDLDALIERLGALDTHPVAAPSHVGLPDGRPARVMVVHGPNGEAFEFVEIED